DLARHFGASGTVRASDPASTVTALAAYFAGDLQALDRVPVDLRGTPFQLPAWAALREIPAATTPTYAQQAAAVGSPRAVRAVGSANGRNPVSLVIPCHRVVATGGGLGGYGGGLDRKRWLIAHEAAHARGSKDVKGASPQLVLGVPVL